MSAKTEKDIKLMRNKIISSFNDGVQNMANELIKIRPNNTKLQAYKVKVEGYLLIDTSCVIKTYVETLMLDNNNQYTDLYLSMIESKNEKFFLDSTYNDPLITEIKEAWSTLSENDKSYIFDMMKYLAYWAKKFYNLCR